jgi:hypothetical protein
MVSLGLSRSHPATRRRPRARPAEVISTEDPDDRRYTVHDGTAAAVDPPRDLRQTSVYNTAAADHLLG